MNQSKIGKIIETKRKEKKLTQKELADYLGVSNTAISKWENGNNLPDISMLEPLCEILELDLLDLIMTKNTEHEDSYKKFAKIRKARLRRTITLSIIFLSILCLTNYYTYNRLMNKRKEELSKNVEVYKITSKDKDIRIDGYAIFNNKENMIILEKIIYQKPDNLNINYTELDEAIYYIYLDKEIMIKRNIDLTKEEINTIRDIIALIKCEKYISDINFNENRDKFHKVKLVLELKDKNNKKVELSSKLQLHRQFT